MSVDSIAGSPIAYLGGRQHVNLSRDNRDQIQNLRQCKLLYVKDKLGICTEGCKKR